MKNINTKKILFHKNKKALTLSELIISSVLISIVMIGVVAFNFSVRQSQNSTNSLSKLKTSTASAMLQIKKDAQLAVGDATNPGIIAFTQGVDKKALCFRQDGGDPSTYTDDKWRCYYHGGSYAINRCQLKDALPIPTNYVLAKCNSAQEEPNFLIQTASTDPFYTIVKTTDADGVDRIDYVEITVATAADASSMKGSPAVSVDCTVDPINNPCYSLTTRISPAGLSR